MSRALRILVLEDDDDLREGLVSLFTEDHGASCVSASSFAGLLARREEALGCDLALLDVNLGALVESGVDAFRMLHAEGFAGRVVFLTGHAESHPLVREARALPNVMVLGKPVDAEVLDALVTADGRAER